MKHNDVLKTNKFVGVGILVKTSLALILSALLLASCNGTPYETETETETVGETESAANQTSAETETETESQTETETEIDTETETETETATVGGDDSGLYGEEDPF